MRNKRQLGPPGTRRPRQPKMLRGASQSFKPAGMSEWNGRRRLTAGEGARTNARIVTLSAISAMHADVGSRQKRAEA